MEKRKKEEGGRVERQIEMKKRRRGRNREEVEEKVLVALDMFG